MNFTICDENKVFPYLIVDDFYSKDEEKLIWEELLFHNDNFKIDDITNNDGVAKSKDNKPLANAKRIYLDDMYCDDRGSSSILKCSRKIVSQDIKELYRKTTPSWKTFEITNRDYSLVSYYENEQYYKEHFDSFMHSALVWFYKKPKRFSGGDLTFTESNQTIECKHNRMILFPSFYLHEVNQVKMDYKYTENRCGRYCMAHFFKKD